MRVPTNQHQEANLPKGFDLFASATLSAGVLLSALVWVLAIAKVVDLCGWH
jgi:hypothetical protein